MRLCQWLSLQMMVRSLGQEIAEGLAKAGYRDCRLQSALQEWARTCNWVEEGSMDKLGLQNPVFATYVIAATIMILKAVSMSWLTVVRMMQVKGGFRSPEDIKKTLLNPDPNPKQIEPNERVERIRRIQLNDLENLPFFLVAGLLFVLTEPSLQLARWLLYGYVVSRLLHFAAYFTARTHDTRATLWTAGSLILTFMTGRTLVAALGY